MYFGKQWRARLGGILSGRVCTVCYDKSNQQGQEYIILLQKMTDNLLEYKIYNYIYHIHILTFGWVMLLLGYY